MGQCPLCQLDFRDLFLWDQTGTLHGHHPATHDELLIPRTMALHDDSRKPSSIEGNEVRFDGAHPPVPEGLHRLGPRHRSHLADDFDDGTAGEPRLSP